MNCMDQVPSMEISRFTTYCTVASRQSKKVIVTKSFNRGNLSMANRDFSKAKPADISSNEKSQISRITDNAHGVVTLHQLLQTAVRRSSAKPHPIM
jgi:hypothetical protein